GTSDIARVNAGLLSASKFSDAVWKHVKIIANQVAARRQGLVLSTGNLIRRFTMSYGTGSTSALSSGSRGGGARRVFEFGRTHVVKPKGRHQATIVWLHGLGDNGSSWSQLLETLALPNIKWICPTAPTRPIALFGGFPSTAWCDVADLSEEAAADYEGLDSSAAHVANLLSTEPPEIKLGVGGFSMGAAIALYSATSCVVGKYSNGDPYPVNITAAVGLSGWLPGGKDLQNKLKDSQGALKRAETMPLLLCHGKVDDVVSYKHGEKSAQVLELTGFANTTFKTYRG
ncbi:hypothetical protein KI387_033771, partial [Taxus chinensis]